MDMMIKKSLLVMSAVGAFSLAAASDVSARSFGIGAGQANAPGDAVCFSRGSGTTTNTCAGGSRGFEVQLPTDNSGSKSVSFTGNNSVSCAAFATNSVNSAFVGSSTVVLPGSGFTTASLSAISLPAGGKLWLGCNVPQNASLVTVNYNQ